MEIIAQLEKVSYIYPESSNLVLKNISLAIHRGEFLGIIGPTGAGKTTLCLTLNGIVPQFYGGRFFGYATVAGLDTLTHPVSTLARYVGAVFEDPETQLLATSIENEIAFTLENLRLPREEIKARIPKVLAAVRLEGMEKKSPGELSGGQKQRLAIAAALAVQPALLILDEPTSQLDPVGSQEVFATIKELNRHLGVTIVMVSHAAEEMAEYADRLVLLRDGAIEAMGTPAEIYSQVQRLQENALRPPQVATTFALIEQNIGALATRSLREIESIPVTLDRGFARLNELKSFYHQITPTPPLSSVSDPLNPILRVKNLCHTYPDGTTALRDVSLDIAEGEYLLIIGQNGAGKSTLVKHFLNLLSATTGQVMIDGRSISRSERVATDSFSVSDLARSIGYVAQNPDNQIFNTTVEKEVSFAPTNLGYPPEIVTQRTKASLEAMGLLEYRSYHPLSLPKGDRARVVIAAILAMEPRIVVFDEPTTGQDYQGAKAILEVSRQLHQMGKTVIVITHHLYLMPEYAERVIIMGQGTILLDAPIRQAYHQTALLAKTYLTPPQAVLLAQKLGQLSSYPNSLLTPQEIADCFQRI
ncbi:MAG: ATP-binding cassette domain-containing protein [Microcystis aeruginosa LL13-03]|jgi:energy-coupling factor transport system ATP-binding protein|nr:energy-coupling factor transporter ATPase [Microcystis aeruginosa WS75]NCR13204.1 ATP-binding cassette domain-containing protein [Microcystis aeruginosa SX13-11]NCR17504.1 ATP-binding cassette domain-containing protein [Microcystis aeruginosa LL13-03]NCR29220.1 ATP-binding cassette domain-containing protein [Microcystis aeruginosa LE13-04]NCR69388.1 ATP-binding cassette domain-containing protein [Microcystis aeruginosa LL11-07]NCS05153.1 ATP-binding cassette domain-containing protein [Micro